MIKAFALAVYLLAAGSLTQAEADKLADDFVHAANQYSVNPTVLVALGWHESSFQAHARSEVGCLGIMMIHPKWWGTPASVRDNIHRGAYVLALYKRKCGAIIPALGAYRSGACSISPRARATWRQSRHIKHWVERGGKLKVVPLP